MREIKFRAFEKNLKEIIQVNNINFEKEMINTGSSWRLFAEVKLMQYTGLKTSISDQEVYEGDILYSVDYGYGEVIWQDGSFCVNFRKCSELLDLFEFLESDALSVVEGNIYQNKELLSCETEAK